MDAAAKRDAGRCGECPYLRIEQGPGGTTCARCFDPDNREIERWYGRTIDYGYSINDVVSYKNCNYERKFTNVVLR